MRSDIPTATAMVGGSFDPVHLGHLNLIHSVLTLTGYRRIILVPVSTNNFKQEIRLASSRDRWEMLLLAVKAYGTIFPDDPPHSLNVDSLELERGGISYTSDTVTELYRTYSIEGKLGVVMGDDLLQGLARWHNFEVLRKEVTFVVARREEDPPAWNGPEVDLRYIPSPLYPDSSTRIRDAIRNLKKHEPLPLQVRNLMPKEVAEYVEEHRLYRD